MEDNTAFDAYQSWKEAYDYLDRNWGAELVKLDLQNFQILQLIEKGKRYLKYLGWVRELKLNNQGAVHLKLVELILHRWEEVKNKPAIEIILPG